MLKYTAELETYAHFTGGHTLKLTISDGYEEHRVERTVGPDELMLQSMFDLIFDDLKKRLKEDFLNKTFMKK